MSPDSMDVVKEAVRRRAADDVRRLLEADPTLRTRLDEPVGDFGGTLLQSAASAGDRAVVDALLDAGARVDARSVWWAGSFGVLDTCAPALAPHLLARGATLTAHAAARLGMRDALAAMLDADASLVHARGGDGQTPLHFAATREIADLLLDRGADVDARDVDHESTPAQWMLDGRTDVARRLVERGATVDLLMAAALGDVERARALLDADPDVVHIRVSDRWFPMRDQRAGGTIYKWTLGGARTPHAIARRRGDAAMLALLLDRSPAPLALVVAGETGDAALAARIVAENPDVVSQLTVEQAQTLADVVEDRNTKAALLLIEAGVPVDVRGHLGATPLHWAAFHGLADVARALVARGAPLEDARNDFRSTPMSWAFYGSTHGWSSRTGDFGATVRALLDGGAAVPPGAADASAAVRAVLG